jgi:hypothetical protein
MINFEHNGQKFKAELRDSNERREKKSRAYVWGPGDERSPSKEFQALADHIGAPSVYTEKGAYPPLDKAFKKMNAEIVAAKRDALDAALVALGAENIGPVKFSRKAGCSCGCSPGFIFQESWGKAIYVERVNG